VEGSYGYVIEGRLADGATALTTFQGRFFAFAVWFQ
jgi:hypothetical protein